MKSKITIESNAQGVITIHIDGLPVAKKEDRGTFIAYCPVLKVTGYSSESADAAFRDFERALNVFFQVHIDDDTLLDALNYFGWTSTASVKKFLNYAQNKVQPSFGFVNPNEIPNYVPRENLQFAI